MNGIMWMKAFVAGMLWGWTAIVPEVYASSPLERTLAFQGTKFRVVEAQPSDVRLFWWNPETRKPFRQFRGLQDFLTARHERLRFVMNGGLFEEDGSPCGLLVVDGKTLRPLNLKDGQGNFYLKPNGVFLISGNSARIVSSEEFAASDPEVRLAIQSGPLLLRRGRIHPAFRKESTNRLHRNGVGVRRDGTVVFAITVFDQERRANLHHFAEFFRSLGCEDALFLDGDLSQMFTDPESAIPPGNYFGTIFAITAPQ